MSNILKIIGSNIRHYRNALNISQEKLAENAGLHRTYIGAVERGEKIYLQIISLKLQKYLALNLISCF